MKPYNARIVVPTPTKAVPLSEFSVIVKTVTIVALSANTGFIHVGGPGVRADAGSANGLPMSGGSRPDAVTLPPPGVPYESIDLHDWWIDATVAGEGVSVFGCQ